MLSQNPERGNTLEVGFETKYVSKDPIRPGRNSKIFSKAFDRLTQGGKHPGKIVLILLNEDGNYRVVGAISENTGGSISFFPDFADKITSKHQVKNDQLNSGAAESFHHMTLNKDFSKRGHFTSEGSARHFTEHDPAEISDGLYCWLSISVTDTTGLDDFPNPIMVQFPITHKSPEDYISLIKDGLKGIIVNSFPTKPTPTNFGGIQILLVKKDAAEFPVSFFRNSFQNELLGNPQIPEQVFSNSCIYETSNGFGYDILLYFFNLEGKPVNDVFIITSTVETKNVQ